MASSIPLCQVGSTVYKVSTVLGYCTLYVHRSTSRVSEMFRVVQLTEGTPRQNDGNVQTP